MKTSLHYTALIFAILIYSSTSFAEIPVANVFSNRVFVGNITTSVSSLVQFNACSGSISSEQNFTVSGTGLGTNITVTAPAGFEISLTTGVGFANSVILVQSLGTVATTTIYVRLKSSAIGTPSGNITCTATLLIIGLSSANVAVNGIVNALPTASISGVAYNCSLVTLTASGGVSYIWSGGNSVNTATNTFNITNSYTVTVTNAAGCTNTAIQAVVINDCTNTWTGTVSSDWTNAANWSKTSLPGDTTSVTIPSGVSFNPNANTIQKVNNLIINNGAALTITGTFQLGGNISNSGTLIATTGTIEMKGSSVQTISANTFSSNTIKNLIINNAAGVTLGGNLNLSGVLTPTTGLLITGGYLTLVSTDIFGGGSIAAGSNSGTYISGNVTVQRYSQAQRGYRTLSHPYNSAQTLVQLIDNFQITGLTGGGLGTYGLSTGNPSAFAYNPSATISPYVSPLTKITNSGYSWGVGQGLYVFVRGNGNEGTGGSYASSGGSPSPVTIDVIGGTINQGNVDVAIVNGGVNTDNYNLIGNPYPSPINLKDVRLADGTTLLNTIASTVYVYNPAYSAGSTTIMRGGFTAITNDGRDIIIPNMGAFYIQPTASATIRFREADKTLTTPILDLFGTGTPAPRLRLAVNNSAGFIDDIQFGFNSSASAVATDRYDAPKLSNSILDFYSLSSGKARLAIDYRDVTAINGSTISLGIQTGAANMYNISLSELTGLPNTQVVLRDKLLKTETVLSNVGDSYSFDITADTATKGENRFEIGLLGTTVLPVQLVDITAQLQTNKTVAVSWTSATELNLAYYNVQRSTDGSNFSTVGKVAATGAGSYTYNDDLSTISNLPSTVYYRLQSVDKDASNAYSKVVSCQLSNVTKPALSIYPNPVQATLYAQVTVTKAGPIDITVTDMQGKLLSKQIAQVAAGTTAVSVNTASLAGGNYVLVIKGTDGIQKQQFVKE